MHVFKTITSSQLKQILKLQIYQNKYGALRVYVYANHLKDDERLHKIHRKISARGSFVHKAIGGPTI